MNKIVQLLKGILLSFALFFLVSFLIGFIDGLIVGSINGFTMSYATYHPGAAVTHFKTHPIFSTIIALIITPYIFLKLKKRKKRKLNMQITSAN